MTLISTLYFRLSLHLYPLYFHLSSSPTSISSDTGSSSFRKSIDPKNTTEREVPIEEVYTRLSVYLVMSVTVY